jgi:hypothetical protein
MGPSDEKAQLWKNHLKFKIKFYWQKIFKFIISPHLSLKIMKSSPRNLMHQMLSKNTKSTTPISYIYKYICSIYNNFCTKSLNITKPPWCTCTYQRFSNIAKSIMRGIVVWEISMWQTNKTNKFPSLIIDRWHVMLAKLWTHCSINFLFKNQNL